MHYCQSCTSQSGVFPLWPISFLPGIGSLLDGSDIALQSMLDCEILNLCQALELQAKQIGLCDSTKEKTAILFLLLPMFVPFHSPNSL